MIVQLTRRATFSAAHNFWLNNESAQQNRLRFGKWAAPKPHGHNYRVELTVAGEVDTTTGMVVNITEVNAALKASVIDVLDRKYLNEEIPYFATAAPTLENLLTFVWDTLEVSLPHNAPIQNLKIYEMDTLWASTCREGSGKMVTSLTRAYEFSASHRLHSQQLSDEENAQIFGKCNNPNGHGHNYEIEVTVSGDPDTATGMLYSLEELDKIVEEEVLLPLDHKHLNLDIDEFRETNPTSEMLTIVIWQRLAKRLPTTGSPRLTSVVVNETPRNSFEYRG